MGLPPIPQQEEDMAQEDGRVHSLHSAEPPNSLSPDCNEKHAFVTALVFSGERRTGCRRKPF